MPIFLWLRTSTPREAPKLEHLSNSARNDEYDSAFPVLFLLELKIGEPVCRICKSTNLHWDLLRRPWKLRVHRYFDWAVASMVALTYATRYCVRPVYPRYGCSGRNSVPEWNGGVAMAVGQHEKAKAFDALHQGPRAFVIANAWDAGSARILEGLGFAAIATSSGASAGTLAMRDGRITRDQALAHARAIVEAVDLPVSADLESGFGKTPEDVVQTYSEAAAIGLVGATIEDATPERSRDKPLFDIGEATERVAAAAEKTGKLDFPFMLTARAEGFLRGSTDLGDVIRRLQAYEKAGARVLMAPGLPDLASVEKVCAAISQPFNFMVGIPGKSFSVAQLEQAGVRRISLATSLYRAAMGGLIAAAREIKDSETFGYVDTSLSSAELAGFMRE
jgi:2-methylisocitrate lyase-like PEP mutase family enzyme